MDIFEPYNIFFSSNPQYCHDIWNVAAFNLGMASLQGATGEDTRERTEYYARRIVITLIKSGQRYFLSLGSFDNLNIDVLLSQNMKFV